MSSIVENVVPGAGTSEEVSVVAVDEEATERDIERTSQHLTLCEMSQRAAPLLHLSIWIAAFEQGVGGKACQRNEV